MDLNHILKKQGTPTMGGIIIIITMILVITGAYIYLTATGQNEVANKLLPMLLISIGFGTIGFIDDFKKLVLKNTKGLKPSYKMIGLLVISVAYVVYLLQILHFDTQTYIPIIKTYIDLPIYIYTIRNYSNISNNKCNKFNRWNRWIIIKCKCNYNNMFSSNRNAFCSTRSISICKLCYRCYIRIFNV